MDQSTNTNTVPFKSKGVYVNYFGFNENPFNLTPDPKYLFLSRSHQEVLAHLFYGVRERKGFVAIIGKVGTGKTTLCRAFLNLLPGKDGDYEVGLIYNPALTDLELLQAINTEFKIDATQTTKGKLIEELNGFLLEANRRGKNVVLVIDEAQKLDPTVLEQLRLISNLETETKKLMQIILMGQPELQKILFKDQWQQLSQRIVVREYLKPLDLHETIEYIGHRVRIASANTEMKELFTTKACQTIHGYSKGIPRLINVLADRALVVAYVLKKKQVTRKVVRRAIADLDKVGHCTVWGRPVLKWASALVGILILLSIGWQARDGLSDIFSKFAKKRQTLQPLSSQAALKLEEADKEANMALKHNTPVEAHDTQEALATAASNQLLDDLRGLSFDESEQMAIKAIMEAWDLPIPVDSDYTFTTARLEHGMHVLRFNGNLNSLRALNYPAILKLRLPQETNVKYVALKHIKDQQGIFSLNSDTSLPLSVLDDLWYGQAYIFWKDFEDLAPYLSYGDYSIEIAWLQKNLKLLGYYDGSISSKYCEKTKAAVDKFQERQGIGVDGIVGPKTKMVLYGQLTIYSTPTLLLPIEGGSL